MDETGNKIGHGPVVEILGTPSHLVIFVIVQQVRSSWLIHRGSMTSTSCSDDGQPSVQGKEEVDDSGTFPKAGVKVSYLTGAFLDELGGTDRLLGMTTAQVCDEIIKPMTARRKSSYGDLLRQQGHHAYGEQAHAFISHAHSYIFLDFISALEWLLRDEPDLLVWIDLVSINQHKPMDWSFKWLSTTFQSAVQSMGRTIMVMSPWDNPQPFTRAWCVFEAYCTATVDGRFEIAMSQADEKIFLDDIKRDVDGRMNYMLANIRAEKSQCSVATDRESIFAAIKESVGFAKLDSMIFEEYRDWAIQVPLHSLSNCEDFNEISLLKSCIGSIYSLQGKYMESERYFQESIECYVQTVGEMHPSTISTKSKLAVVYDRQGRHQEATDLHQSCLLLRTDVLGPDHPDTLLTLHNLAWGLSRLGKFSEARDLYETCFERRKVILGTRHPHTLETMNSLAMAFNSLGNYSQAQSLCESCLELQKDVHGMDHPDTLITMHNLASVFDSQGKARQAQQLYESCLEREVSIFGRDHPTTLATMDSLAAALAFCRTFQRQSEFHRAKELFEFCLDRRKNVLGKNHPDTLDTMNSLASVAYIEGDYDQAIHLYESCYEGHKVVLSESHPDTIMMKNNLEFAKANHGTPFDKMRTTLGSFMGFFYTYK